MQSRPRQGALHAASSPDFAWAGNGHEHPSSRSWAAFLSQEPRCPFETPDAEVFDGRIVGHFNGEALLTDVSGTVFVLRDRWMAPPPLLLQAVISGNAYLSRAAEPEQEIDKNSLVFRFMDSQAQIRVPGEGRLVSLAFPRRYLSSHFLTKESLDVLLGVHRDSMAMQLLRNFLVTLNENSAGPKQSVARIFETIGALCGMRLDELPVNALPPGVKSGRTRQETIQKFLAENFSNPDLSPAFVAEQLGISTRYIHKLMKQGGKTFNDEVTRLRLNFCKSALMEWHLHGRSISEIAFAAGFRELSRFNRHFRMAYGTTPSDARKSFLSTGTQPGGEQ